jgi:ABC-type antimicrobial peptide transport system permease subunit
VVYASLPPALTSRFSLRVRSNAPDAIAADLRTLLRDVDPRVAWTSLRRGDASYLEEAVEMRGGLPVIAGCAIVALLLAATGLFAVISYVVTLRRREIGVRLAIGARPQQIVGLVMHQAAWLVVFGTVAGLALALPAAFTMRATFVAPVHATDPLAFVPNVALLAVVAFLAAVLPARQAAAVDPAKTLRQD